MDTIKQLKQRIYRELSKLRSSLTQILKGEDEQPEVIPNIVIAWGDITDESEGLTFDGTLDWQNILDHIINVGITAVLGYTRICKVEDQLDRLRHHLRILNTTIRQYLEHAAGSLDQARQQQGKQAKCSWNVV